MALHDTSNTNKREVYRQYRRGELTESEARAVIGEDWEAVVTGSMMERDLETIDWETRYADEPIQ